MKYYYLNSCSTCKRIAKDIGISQDIADMREIKSSPITKDELDEMKDRAGSYEALFNKRARKFKEEALKDKDLNEEDFKKLMLREYTFLKRPVLMADNDIFVGNSKKTVIDASRYIADME